MKNRFFRMSLAGSAALVLAGAGNLLAQTASNSPAFVPPVVPEQPAVVSPVPAPAPARLSYGVEDVLKLSRAQVSEGVIINYIENSGVIYSLTSSEIVYLRGEGVTDRVLATMLNQRAKVTADVAAQNAAQAAAAQAAAAQAAASAPAPAPAPTQAPPGAYAPAPDTQAQAPASSLYVIQDPSVQAAYSGYPYYYYPYYYGGYWGPSVSIGLGFGGYWHGGYWHGGGWHGGYHGGWHGGHR